MIYQNRFRKIVFTLTILFLFLVSVNAYSKTIVGVVTGLKGTEVQVTYDTPSGITMPNPGDKVTFKTKLEGIEMDGGAGLVRDYGYNFVWVTPEGKPPSVGSEATIEASGNLHDRFSRIVQEHRNGSVAHLPVLKAYAENGHKNGVFYYCSLISSGTTVSSDLPRAAEMLKQCAQNNGTLCNFLLGLSYYPNYPQLGLEHLKKATEVSQQVEERGIMYHIATQIQKGESNYSKNPDLALKIFRWLDDAEANSKK